MIEDVNDNNPVIPEPNRVLCSKDGKWGSILVEAEDNDQSPYSGPFTFALGSDSAEKWKLKDSVPGMLV